MIKNGSILLFFLIFSSLNAQTMLSGVVNVYSGLIAQNECMNAIEIANPDDFTIGMAILIIQTDGANIQTTNGESFGNITNLNGAGLYEYNRIIAIDGAALRLEKSLQNSYLASNTQVIGVEIHSTIIVNGDITAPAWDGNKGGIVLIEAENSIELQANINASGLGFRSGQPYVATDDACSFVIFSNNFSYESGNWRGAPKGEGIAAIINGAENGRGAQANGGGGGNSHNSGGGGGALYSEGGSGGINDEPEFFNCHGNFAGRGGKALANDPSRLFFGGAGGNGHTNNSDQSLGGKGGGIIILIAPAITFNGGQLMANGQDGQAPPAGDGSAGGGAAGSILIDAQIINGDIDITAQGGNGGDVNNSNQNRCFGPGGGGGGGFLAANQPFTAQLEGGTPGLSLNSTVCTGSNGAGAGGNGIMNSNFTGLVQGEAFIVPSILSFSNDTTICSAASFQLFVEAQGENLHLQWQYLQENEWINMEESATFSGTQTNMLHFNDPTDFSGTYQLLISPESDCFEPFASSVIEVGAATISTSNPSAIINGFDVEFTANANNFNTLQWTFLEGASSNEANPSFTFSTPGTYEVILETENDCGLVSNTIIIEIVAPFIVQFSSSTTSGCAPLDILFTDESIGNITQRTWTFEGGIPNTSTDATPLIQFPEAGDFEINLTIQNDNNSNSISTIITVLERPSPSFSTNINELNVTFINTSSNANSYVWSFGDGESSTQESPSHSYTTPGTYEVSLNAVNDFCGSTFIKTVVVTITNVNEINKQSIYSIFPNPSAGLFYLEGFQSGSFDIFDINGKRLKHQQINAIKTVIDLSHLPDGIYILVVNNEKSRFIERLLKG